MDVLIILSLVIYGVAASPISATNNNNQKISGGNDAHDFQFPYQVLIRYTDNLETLCGGSIISNEWILTCASCAELAKEEGIKIVVGSIYLNSGGIAYTVHSSIKHPDYTNRLIGNDIGLIRVNGRINYNEFVRPIRLFSDSTSVDLPLAIVAGWGIVGLRDNSRFIPEWNLPDILQYTIVKPIPLDECKKKVIEGPTIHLTDKELCTYDKDGKSTCLFDNGSPLVFNGEQHAIVSAPNGCFSTHPDIHTRVAPFRSWIKNITNV